MINNFCNAHPECNILIDENCYLTGSRRDLGRFLFSLEEDMRSASPDPINKKYEGIFEPPNYAEMGDGVLARYIPVKSHGSKLRQEYYADPIERRREALLDLREQLYHAFIPSVLKAEKRYRNDLS